MRVFLSVTKSADLFVTGHAVAPLTCFPHKRLKPERKPEPKQVKHSADQRCDSGFRLQNVTQTSEPQMKVTVYGKCSNMTTFSGQKNCLPTKHCSLLSHSGAALTPFATRAKKAFFTCRNQNSR